MKVDYKVRIYDWLSYTYTYVLKKHEKVTGTISLAYCKPGVYLLYHTASMKTITMGKKREMKELAHLIEKDFIFDGLDKWISKDNKTVIRSLSEIY